MSANATRGGTRITTQDGTQIYYKDWGAGQPIVFSHGWPLNADAWQNQMVFLAQNGYRTIAHDLGPKAGELLRLWLLGVPGERTDPETSL